MTRYEKLKFCLTIAWALAIAGAFLLGASTAQGREGYQGRPLICDVDELDPQGLAVCRSWIGNVKRPDQPRYSCCGEGDAFEANAFEVSPEGNYIAVLTKDYPPVIGDDGEGGSYVSRSYSIGTRITIPKDKVNRAYENGNPTGKGIVFISGTGEVLCYFSPTLS